jgi:outer membrane protein OmpA-like peptidoglycan-associated protein
MKLRHILTATCFVLPLAAKAQPVTGPYVSLGGGLTVPNSQHYGYNPTATSGQFGHFNIRPGYAGEISLGYGLGDGFRFEVEGNLAKNVAHSDHDNMNGDTKLQGAQYTYGALANVLYDFPIGLPISPYIGGGVGYEYQKLNHLQNGVGDSYSGTKGSLAYDAIGGLSYDVAYVPGLAVTAQYQFMQLTASRNYDDPLGGATIKIKPTSSHTFMLGLRYQIFNPPMVAPDLPSAPVAAPGPLPARTYLVFFDWDKSSLTPRATQIIAEAASDSHTTATTMISVSGYTDTSGTVVYNQGLSERRARAVAAQLVTDGVPGSEISIHAFGETHLLVPTGPGVREPQNRRVEIVLN